MRASHRHFWRSADGNVAMMFGFLAVPLIGMAGLAVDYTRASSVRAEMQNAADSAALAAASKLPDAAALSAAEQFFAAETSSLALAGPATVSVTKPSEYTVRVEASGKVETTLLAVLGQEISVGVGATAERGAPSKEIDLKIKEFNADAWDANTIAWYVVPEDSGEPADEDLTAVRSNDPQNPITGAPEKITIGADQEIGFAMINVTGGVKPYGKNGYGQPQGSVHYFYSHREPENVKITGSPDCTHGKVKQAWDDNGGGTDDNDYNDAVFEYQCTITASVPTDVRLIE
jgi:Flp pilus assembly protein TadG